MRSFTLIALLALPAACSGGQMGQQGAENTESTAPGGGDVAQTRQAAQFADNTILNLVDPGLTMISLTAEDMPTTVQIRYIGDKTTDSGTTTGTDGVAATISLAANQTMSQLVNIFDPAFNNGYGAVTLSSTTGNPFQTYVEYSSGIFSVGGSVFQGGVYRLPYLQGTAKVVLVVTNQDGATSNITFQNVGGSDVKTIALPPLSTYRFDTQALNWHLNAPSSINVSTDNSGIFALSGYVQSIILTRQRITPVKAAPFP